MDFVQTLCAVLALFIGYFGINREGRADLQACVRRVVAFIRPGAAAVIALGCVVGLYVIAFDLYSEITAFADDPTPITRPEIVRLLGIGLNFLMYTVYSGLATVFVAGRAIRRIRNRS